MIRAHWDYAWASGDNYYAVRATHRLCDRLVEKSPSEARLHEIHHWTYRALHGQTANAEVWGLWAKVLYVLGAREASLDVRWEAVRRFPNNSAVRMALVASLKGRGQTQLATDLFKVTLRDFGTSTRETAWLAHIKGNEFAIRDSQVPHPSRLEAGVASDKRSLAANTSRWTGAWVTDPDISSVLAPLARRRPLLERCFTPLAMAERRLDSTVPDPITSEFELVAACRGRSLENGLLDTWLRARPASYSARLLSVSRDTEAASLDEQEIARLEAEFPQHREWNEWLSYPFAPSPRRSQLRSAARRTAYWAGRLKTVYPGLGVRYCRELEYDPGALRRLFEDVALATAETGLPQPAPARQHATAS